MQGSDLEIELLSVSNVLSKFFRMSSCFVGAGMLYQVKGEEAELLVSMKDDGGWTLASSVDATIAADSEAKFVEAEARQNQQ